MRSARAEAPLQRLRAQIRRSRPRGCCYCLKGTLKYGEGRPIRTSVRATFLSSWLVASLAAISLSACDSTPDDSVLVRPEATFTIEKTGVGKTEFDATCVETRGEQAAARPLQRPYDGASGSARRGWLSRQTISLSAAFAYSEQRRSLTDDYRPCLQAIVTSR